MKLFTFKRRKNPGFRWALCVARWSVYVQQEYLHEGKVWYVSRDYVGVGTYWPPRFGSDHGWYDGPHCAFYVGPIQFFWSLWDCKKCREQNTR